MGSRGIGSGGLESGGGGWRSWERGCWGQKGLGLGG